MFFAMRKNSLGWIQMPEPPFIFGGFWGLSIIQHSILWTFCYFDSNLAPNDIFEGYRF